MMGEMLNYLAKIDMVHVPYQGLAPAMGDLISNRVQISFSTYPGAVAFLKSGKVKALGVTGKDRMKTLPDVPAIAESVPGYDAAGWWGYVAPAGTPQPILDKLNKAINKVVQAPEFSQQFASEGVQMLGTTPQGFVDHVQREIKLWSNVGASAHITLE
jgi:tripartite-type tricarboxylate transporter receptor subunit TctC